jgi:endo-1,4-beta-mannosidase
VIGACGRADLRQRHEPARRGAAKVVATVDAMRVISYYPARNPWGGMWAHWNPSVIDTDLAKAAALGANTVRVFVQPAAFGYPAPQQTDISRLRQLLSIAAAHSLKVQLTLFDLWNDYADIRGSRLWAAKVLAPFRGDPRIAAVELKNEVDPNEPLAMAWTRAMLPSVRTDVRRPVTVSVMGWNTATPLRRLISALGRVHPDFYDLHFYGTPQYMLATFRAAKRMAGGAPLIIGETGYSTDPANDAIGGVGPGLDAHEREQAAYYVAVERAAYVAGLPRAGVWTLNDFPPLAHVNAVEQHFGLFRLDGAPKPATSVIREAFTGSW